MPRKSKLGRPHVKNERAKIIAIRVTEEEQEQVRVKADAKHLTISAYARMVLLEQ